MNKILIADDESNILMLLEVMLNEIDAEIITAENGEVISRCGNSRARSDKR